MGTVLPAKYIRGYPLLLPPRAGSAITLHIPAHIEHACPYQSSGMWCLHEL